MAAIDLKCKRCNGKLYEVEVYYELKVKKIELGCYQCPHRLYLDFKKYKDFLKMLDASR